MPAWTFTFEKFEPVTEKCRTCSLGVKIPGSGTELYLCKLDAFDCRYAWVFGYDCFCRHPDRERFSQRGLDRARTDTAAT